MKKKKKYHWKKHGFEFLSIFVAVISAFALNNWNENKINAHSENKILTEISNGLEKDLADIKLNIKGHKVGIGSCNYFKNIFIGNDVNRDSIMPNYFNLTRDFLSIQNVAGYETLKSKGLELITNDSLRLKIISLYEYDFNTLEKLEEEYKEMQFQENYFKEINDVIAPNFVIDSLGNIADINLPIKIEENSRKKLLLYLWKIQSNREFTLRFYAEIENKINAVRKSIAQEIQK